MKRLFLILSLFTFHFSLFTPSQACTNFLFTKGATKDGSTMITYAADSHTLYGELYYRPAADYAPGTMMQVVDWDSGKKLIMIPQVTHTYSVVGNMNEWQLTIGETTYGGREELANEIEGGVDYGSYIYLTLQRAKNVREAFVKLKKENPTMKGVILDLRGNGGGLMNEAVDIVNIWVPRGTLVVETKGKIAAKNMKSLTRLQPEDTEIPLAVIIDGSSASASEIVSGSLQDLDRAVIIGQRSFGKGLVQNILPMPYNSQMKVTVSKYYIPSGRCIQAIDYSHRDENGRALKVPDSLKTAFKTLSGRTVYDGFGIEPDIEIEPEYMSNIAIALTQKLLIFDYATHFYRSHESIAPAADFEINDDIYNDFCHFLKERNLTYSTTTERYIKQLRDIAKQEKYDSAIEQQLKEMEQRLESEKEGDLTKHRNEICDMLKAEILTRYYYDEGRLQGALKHDPTILRAVKELSKE